MPGRIFVNYRREDERAMAARVRDRLAHAFGDRSVFMDVDQLKAGQRFDQELEKALAETDVLLAVIGPRWLSILHERQQTGERDFVVDEIAGALGRGVVVIPVLIEGAQLPRADDLPNAIRDLVLHQKHGITHERFGRDADDLAEAIRFVRRERRREDGRATGGNWRLWAGAGAAALLLLGGVGAFQAGLLPGLSKRDSATGEARTARVATPAPKPQTTAPDTRADEAKAPTAAKTPVGGGESQSQNLRIAPLTKKIIDDSKVAMEALSKQNKQLDDHARDILAKLGKGGASVSQSDGSNQVKAGRGKSALQVPPTRETEIAAVRLCAATDPVKTDDDPALSEPNVDRYMVQIRLHERGHLDGRLDGKFGPKTRAAIKSFQRWLGTKETGYLTRCELQALGLTPEVGAPSLTGLAYPNAPPQVTAETPRTPVDEPPRRETPVVIPPAPPFQLPPGPPR